ncbi:transcriptional regulator, TetR family [Kribbella flavida DSM 17836]|uniref:Transcriptional regulator, TetR family n=1 Tax=Kribbella flavida (strain DSM 17836 / JCM 10339 / NBRC 14399) TaxID=479435 RepID=D2PQY1_KRIFD|nr:TetR/AcrR family transcriptional regulator [Kribbella flavida]ADB31114.1 transcriptional regulator, TetR family [Kribbella flavida DSM 17836]
MPQSAPDRKLTLTEQARRAQLIAVTVDLVAEVGYASTSLAKIAERAGVTKAAVLYYYPSKNALVETARDEVLTALVTAVGDAVDAVGPEDWPAAYVRTMIEHLRDNPRHTRMIVEAAIHTGAPADPAARWGPLADILAAARRARDLTDDPDLRSAAIVIGGAIDAIVSEHMHDPSYDTTAATDLVLTMIERTVLSRS